MCPQLAISQSRDIKKNPFTPQLPPPPKRQEIIPTPTYDNNDQTNSVPAIPTDTQVQAAPEPPPDLKISGLVWNTSRPQAIVNDRVVDVGDVIEEAKIVSIRRDGIKIEFKGQNFDLSP